MTRTIAALLAFTAVAGCAALPNVVYHQLGPGPHHDAWVPFRLTDSIVVIGEPAAAQADGGPPVSLGAATVRCPDAACGPLAVATVPTDFRGAAYAIEPKSRRFVSTSAAPTYYANSLRLKALTIEAKDHRLEAINTIAALAGGAAKLAAKGMNLSNDDVTDTTPVLILPVTIALADARCAAFGALPCAPATAATPQPLPRNPGWTYWLAYDDDPAASGFVPARAIDTVHGAMVAAACRRAHVELRHATPAVAVTLATTIADPEWLVTVPFPAKGALTFHPLCGIDVQPQAVTEIGVDAMAAAFVHGVEQVAAKQRP